MKNGIVESSNENTFDLPVASQDLGKLETLFFKSPLDTFSQSISQTLQRQ